MSNSVFGKNNGKCRETQRYEGSNNKQKSRTELPYEKTIFRQFTGNRNEEKKSKNKRTSTFRFINVRK